MTTPDVPLPSPGDDDWIDWGAEVEELTDQVRELLSGAHLEAVVIHDGTTGGGTRPTGYARVVWVSPTGAAHSRPTNMAAEDVWEHDA